MRPALLLITSLSACYAGSELGPEPADAGASGGESSSSGTAEPDPEPPAGSSSSTGVEPSAETGADSESGSTTGSADESGISTGEPETGSSSGGEALLGCDALPDALLCEDFDGELDPTIWQTVTAPGADAQLVDGQLQIQLSSLDNAHGFIRTESIFPVADNRFFGRVLMQITPYSPTGHDYLMSAEGPLDGTTARYRLDSNNHGRLNSRYTHASVPQHGGWRKLGYQTQGEVWTCLEWEFDGATNSMRFWFDGVLDEDILVDGAVEDPPWVAPAFERFELGYRTYQAALNGDDFTIAYDDLALDLSRIGCPDQRSSG